MTTVGESVLVLYEVNVILYTIIIIIIMHAMGKRLETRLTGLYLCRFLALLIMIF